MSYKVGDKFVIEIEKVYKSDFSHYLYMVKGFNSLVFDKYGLDKLKRVPQRSEKPLLTEMERDYLAAVIAPYKGEVAYIMKSSGIDCEYIQIMVDSHPVLLPYFRTGTMYTGMEADTRYLLEELGL